MTKYYIKTDKLGTIRGAYDKFEDVAPHALNMANANPLDRVFIEKIEPGNVVVLFEVIPNAMTPSQ